MTSTVDLADIPVGVSLRWQRVLCVLRTRLNTVVRVQHIPGFGSSLPSCDIDWSTIGWIAGGAAVAVIGTPVIVGLAGFTSTGITAGSIGAHLMSASAVLNGGGVASGGVVATLQSVGAAGFSTVGTTVLGTFGAVTGCLSKSYLKHSSDKS